MKHRMDLHLHTNISDGSDSVTELYEIIKDAGISTFSVTDHDILDGTLEMETLISPEDNLNFIRGIEFSCVTPVKKCHILGYNFDPENPQFQDAYRLGISLRKEKFEKRIAYLEDSLSISLTEAELQWLHSIKSPVKPHFGQIIVNRGLAPDLETAIKQYVSPCKIANDRIDAAVAIRAITSSGGIAIWAHPLGGEGERRLTKEEFHLQLEALLANGIQGLECFYSRYSREDIDFLLAEAKKHHLLISAGSDYHGENKKNLPIGKLSKDDLFIDEADVTILNMF